MLSVLRLRYVLFAVFIAILAGVVWYAGSYMKFELFPTSSADRFKILVELPTGTSLRATSDQVKKIEAVLDELPRSELASYVTRIGHHSYYAAGENENWAIIAADLTPFSRRSRNADEIVEELRSKTDALIEDGKVVYKIEGGGPPVGSAITIRAVGSDDTVRTQLADNVVAYLGTIEGVKDIDRDDKPGKDQVEIDVDYDKLARLGLTVADVAQNVRIAYDGEVVTRVRYGDEDVDFRVQLVEEARTQPDLLKDLRIPNREGRLIPLSDVSDLVTIPGPNNFYHYGDERAITVTAELTKGTTTSLEATNAVLDHFDLDRDYPGMRFVVGGEAEESAESMVSLFRSFIVAAVAIYFLLVLLFNSLGQPLMVMVAIPFGIIGVIVMFALHGQPLGFLAMMGVIGLAGVVVNDSLVLVSHINTLRRETPGVPVKELVARGTANRLRAVILTTLTTVAGVLPLAYGVGGSDPLMAPMAFALGWGLVFATPLTLILVPCIYLIGNDVSRLFRRSGKEA
jgi:multidrug efflux pump subunit AcrB